MHTNIHTHIIYIHIYIYICVCVCVCGFGCFFVQLLINLHGLFNTNASLVEEQ